MLVRLIRHGLTVGNLEKRYIGARTDEDLCARGIAELSRVAPLPAERWVVSPMKRCRHTALILNGGTEPEACETAYDLRECDFGDFENKNYRELSGDEAYQRWIESGGTLPFPNGESREEFTERTCRAFGEICTRLYAGGCRSVNFVVHGGSVMAVAERFGLREDGKPWSYYEAQVANGAYLCGTVSSLWETDRKIVLKRAG